MKKTLAIALTVLMVILLSTAYCEENTAVSMVDYLWELGHGETEDLPDPGWTITCKRSSGITDAVSYSLPDFKYMTQTTIEYEGYELIGYSMAFILDLMDTAEDTISLSANLEFASSTVITYSTMDQWEGSKSYLIVGYNGEYFDQPMFYMDDILYSEALVYVIFPN